MLGLPVAQMAPVPDQDFSGPVIVTLLYTLLFDVLLVHQVTAKERRGKQASRFDYSDKRWEAVDRTFMNFVEQ